MGKKFYIVIHQNVATQFYAWRDCKKFIENKKNIRYKGFENEQEGIDFINNNIKRVINIGLPDILYAYVGSYANSDKERYGYGYVTVMNKSLSHENFGEIKKQEYSSITGEDFILVPELTAILKAIEYAIKINEERIVIISGFVGVKMWGDEEWKPKNTHCLEYVRQLKEYKKVINIDFIIINSGKDVPKESVDANYQVEFAKKAALLAKRVVSKTANNKAGKT